MHMTSLDKIYKKKSDMNKKAKISQKYKLRMRTSLASVSTPQV